MVRIPPGIYTHGLEAKPLFGTDFELYPNISLQRNIISTIGINHQCTETPLHAPNLVKFGQETAENGWRVFAHNPAFFECL